MDPDATHRRVEDDTPLCVFAGMVDMTPGDKPTVTDDIDAVTCPDCLLFAVD